MDKVKDRAESDAARPPSQELVEPRRPSPEPFALLSLLSNPKIILKDNYNSSPEHNEAGEFDESDPTFSLVTPGIDRADVSDLLENEMPLVTGSWSLKRGEHKILSFRSLKLVITHESENTMMQVLSTRPTLLPPFATTQLTSVSRAT